MSNESLRIGVAYWPGQIDACVIAQKSLHHTNECKYMGLDADLLRYLLKLTRIKYELVVYGAHDYGAYYENGSVTGLLGDVANGKLDMCGSSWTLGEIRTGDYFEYSSVTFYSSTVILKLGNSASLWQRALLLWNVFTPTMWGVVSLFMLGVTIILAVSTYYNSVVQNTSTVILISLCSAIYSHFLATLRNTFPPMANIQCGSKSTD
jgi:hypothetical protein